jgi:putative membrane-bound dehydrogenase-like protein
MQKKWFGFLAAMVMTNPVFPQESSPDKDSLDKDYTEQLPRIAPLDPSDALDSFEIHPDFELQLIASEPLVFDPIAMAFDEAGRMFVVEMRGYSEQRQEHMGGIALLEDTNGDSVFDTRHEYVSGLAWPTAVACWDGGIYVGNPPEIRYYKDTDGDHIADHEEVVFTGFGLSNVQGLMNSFRWGLDNRIYGATSSSGASIRPGNQPDAVPLELRGRDFSFDPRTNIIRAESGGGQHGMTFDTWGNRYASHNSNHIQLFHYDDAYMARNPYLTPPRPLKSIASDGPAADVYRISEVEPWRIVRTRLRVKGMVPGPVEGGGTPAGYFTSATGVTMYKGDAWPSQYVNQAFIGDVGSNLVHRKVIRNDGLTKIADRARPNTEFIRSNDIWFRPAQFANGPDGNLYIADMYRETIEHPDSLPPLIKKHLDLTSGNDRGRIYRVMHRRGKTAFVLDLSTLNSRELAGLLNHPNAWHRETAARLLYERQDRSIVADLNEMAASAETSATGVIQALHTLQTLSESPNAVLKALDHPNPDVRIHSIRLAERFSESQRIYDELQRTARGALPIRVQYALAFALGEFPPNPETTERLARLAAAARSRTPVRQETSWMDWAILSSAGTETAQMLLTMTAGTNSDTFYREAHKLAGALSPAEDLEELIRNRDGFVPNLIEGMRMANRTAELSALAVREPRLRSLLETAIAEATRTATDSKQKINVRQEAVRTLLLDTFSAQRSRFEELLSGQHPPSIKETVLLGLRNYEDDAAGALILDRWSAYTPRVREAAIESLFSKRAWLIQLLDQIEDKTIPAGQIDSVRKKLLVNHKSNPIRVKASELFAKAPDNKTDLIARYTDVLNMGGDAIRGKNLYIENCSPCHKIGRDGYAVGPDLTTVIQSGPEKILTNILAPNQEVNPQYGLYTVETKDGDLISGIVSSETANTVTLLRSNAQSDTILRHNIISITAETISLMPEEWEEVFSKQDFADLLAFLGGLE